MVSGGQLATARSASQASAQAVQASAHMRQWPWSWLPHSAAHSRQVAMLAEDLDLRTGTLDPIGAQLEPGPQLYPRLITGIADALMVCLNGG